MKSHNLNAAAVLFHPRVVFYAAREFRPFKVAGRKAATVAGQWRLINAKILAEKDGPIGTALAGVPTSRLRSHFAYMLKNRREMENNHVHWLASGGNGIPVQVEAKLVRKANSYAV